MLPQYRPSLTERVEYEPAWGFAASGPERGLLSMTNAIDTRPGEEGIARDMETRATLLASLTTRPGTLQQLSWRLKWKKPRLWSALHALLASGRIAIIRQQTVRRGRLGRKVVRVYGVLSHE